MSVSDNWVVEFSTVSMREPIQVRVTKDIIIGRVDPDENIRIDVDLAPFGGEEGGVSREHLKLYVQNDRLLIQDLNSGNGSRLNGQRLEANIGYQLGHIDQLRLGTLEAEIRVVAAPDFVKKTSDVPAKKQTQILKYGSGELVQIVEDHVEIAQLFSLTLQKQGYSTIVNRDMQRAIRQFEQKRPRAIILDLMLPDENGIKYCEYVRKEASQAEIPIIIVSAIKMEKNRREALDAGANAYLTKPLQPHELGAAVAQQLLGAGAGNEAYGGGDSASTRAFTENSTPAGLLQPEISDNTIVLVVAGYSDYPLTLTLRRPMSFGRQAPNNRHTNHINLSRFNASEMGVSRVHMYMQFHEGRFYVEDAGSTNGTFLEGKPLKPSKPTRVRNGDEIRLGQMRLYAFFLSETDRIDKS